MLIKTDSATFNYKRFHLGSPYSKSEFFWNKNHQGQKDEISTEEHWFALNQVVRLFKPYFAHAQYILH